MAGSSILTFYIILEAISAYPLPYLPEYLPMLATNSERNLTQCSKQVQILFPTRPTRSAGIEPGISTTLSECHNTPTPPCLLIQARRSKGGYLAATSGIFNCRYYQYQYQTQHSLQQAHKLSRRMAL